MKDAKIYEVGDKMISVIRDNYEVLQSLGSFGISLGFGDRTIGEVCRNEGVDAFTFLTVVNFAVNGYLSDDDLERLSVTTLLHYLQASHRYFLDYEIPSIREKLVSALNEDDNLALLIMKLYDGYARSVDNHMRYEEKTVFPYVESLIAKTPVEKYNIDTFSKHHGQIGHQLKELKDIIIRYLPADGQRNNQLTAALYDIHNSEAWLDKHARVEDEIFIPAIRIVEQRLKQSGVSAKISNMINKNPDNSDSLSEREKDVVIGIVQGMSNKEIAEHLFISVNTVITHRRNIARKLQIHSPAGLTIYAIVNDLVDISNVK